MLDRVLAYVRSVLASETKGDAAVGRYLMETFGASTEELDKGAFNASLQVQTIFPSNSPCVLTDPALPGHPHGLLPRQPRPLASRSFLALGACYGFVATQKGDVRFRLLLYLYLLSDVPNTGVAGAYQALLPRLALSC